MTRHLWWLLNPCASNAIYNCTHGGRNMKWGTALYDIAAKLIQEQVRCLVCEWCKPSVSAGCLSSSDWAPGIGTPNREVFFHRRDGRNQKTKVIKN